MACDPKDPDRVSHFHILQNASRAMTTIVSKLGHFASHLMRPTYDHSRSFFCTDSRRGLCRVHGTSKPKTEENRCSLSFASLSLSLARQLALTFLDDNKLVHGTSKMDIPSLNAKEFASYGSFMARFRGSLLTLFGKPLFSGSDADEAFTYIIKARNSNGQRWLITAYDGPSGPAFGAIDPLSLQSNTVAESLLALVEATPPADFEAILEVPDFNSIITYGCRNSESYWNEEQQ